MELDAREVSTLKVELSAARLDLDVAFSRLVKRLEEIPSRYRPLPARLALAEAVLFTHEVSLRASALFEAAFGWEPVSGTDLAALEAERVMNGREPFATKKERLEEAQRYLAEIEAEHRNPPPGLLPSLR